MSLRDDLNAIKQRAGVLTPALVLEEARPAESRLHARFEWDDAIAGEAYRLEQAHRLIQSVQITQRRPDGSKLTVRAFQAIRNGPNDFVYGDSDEVVRDPLQHKLVIREMEREIRILESRYRDFEEFWQLIRGLKRRRAS